MGEGGRRVGSQVNMFEQVSSDDRQMLEAGERGLVWYNVGGSPNHKANA